MNKFEAGKDYRCISTTGAYISFVEGDATEDMSNRIYLEIPEVYMRMDGVIRKFKEGIVTFQREKMYKCITVAPLLFDGYTYMPALNGNEYVKDAYKVLSLLMQETKIEASKATIRMLTEMLDWYITTQWDGSVDSMRKIVVDKLQRYCTPADIYGVQAGLYEREAMLWVSVFLPSVYPIVSTMLNLGAYPPDVIVKWPPNQAPICLLPDGTPLAKWAAQFFEDKSDEYNAALARS